MLYQTVAASAQDDTRDVAWRDLQEIVCTMHRAGTTVGELEQMVGDHSIDHLLGGARMAHSSEEVHLLTFERACQRIGVPVEYVRLWAKSGLITTATTTDGDTLLFEETVHSLIDRPADRPPPPH